MTNQIGFYNENAPGWERALYAFLAEKQRRSGSRRRRSRIAGRPGYEVPTLSGLLCPDQDGAVSQARPHQSRALSATGWGG